jgi:hypothetical protein
MAVVENVIPILLVEDLELVRAITSASSALHWIGTMQAE